MNSGAQVWLVTGTSSGLGKCLVTSVLSRGDCVVATVRKPSSLDDLALTEEQKGRLRVLILDITDSEENIRKLIGEAWVVWGRVDILVNNAGRASTKALMEEGGLELMRAEYETNVFGTMKVTNAVLPHMRQRKSGLIVFLGSRVVWQANTPVASSYISSKAAIHAISETLAAEVAQFGIRVLLAIPGGFRTSQLDGDYTMNHHVSDYDGYREEILNAMQERWKQAQGDPAKAMEVLVDAIKGEGKAEGMATPSWLLIGKPTFTQATLLNERLSENVSQWEGVSRDLDYDRVDSHRP